MPKTITYVCQDCGCQQLRWHGRCPDCGGWGSLVEEVAEQVSSVAPSVAKLTTSSAVSISEVPPGSEPRRPSGLAEFDRVLDAARELQGLPLFIDDTPALSVPALRTRARRLKRQHGLSLIVVDYLQLMSPTASGRSDNRVQEVSEITRGLKAVAKELNVPVVALSQLSRAVEQREDKRPQLSDLRESGAIEQDADIVMFIHRELFGNEDSPDAMENRGMAEIIIAKHRNGPTGMVKLFFNQACTSFKNLDRQYSPPPAGSGNNNSGPQVLKPKSAFTQKEADKPNF